MSSDERNSQESPLPIPSVESFLVGARVRGYISNHGLKVADESVDELNRRVRDMLDEAISRTKANKRLTLRPHDF